jgi:hypothetical protein
MNFFCLTKQIFANLYFSRWLVSELTEWALDKNCISNIEFLEIWSQFSSTKIQRILVGTINFYKDINFLSLK